MKSTLKIHEYTGKTGVFLILVRRLQAESNGSEMALKLAILLHRCYTKHFRSDCPQGRITGSYERKVVSGKHSRRQANGQLDCHVPLRRQAVSTVL
jgi:hypothetical protein